MQYKAKVVGALGIDCNMVSVLFFFSKESNVEQLNNAAKVDELFLGHLTEQNTFQLIKLLWLQVEQSIFSELKY